MKSEQLSTLRVEPEIKQALTKASETEFTTESAYRKKALVGQLKKDGYLKCIG